VKQGTTELLYTPGPGSFTVGKDPSNDLVVQDRFISSRHLKVPRCEVGFHVRDLSSTNGTYLDGVLLYEAEVPLNTVLRVGRRSCSSSRCPRARGRRPSTGWWARTRRCSTWWSR